jgi:VHL beta domain
MVKRCAFFVCAALTSCSLFTGLSDYGIGAFGGTEDASAPNDDTGTGADPMSYVHHGQEGGFGSAPEADANANADAVTDDSPDVQLAQDGSVGSEAALEASGETGAEAGVDAAADAGPDAGPVLTFSPSSASLSILAADAGICSMSAAQSASLHLINARAAGVAFVWVGYSPQCTESAYGNVAPGGSQDVASYVGHVWRIKNQSDGQFITEFRLDSPASYTVTVH